MSKQLRSLRTGDVLNTPAPPAGERINYGPDPLHFADLRLPPGEGPHPVAVVIHGGFWRNKYSLEHIGHLSDALAKSGVATWAPEYRRVGDEGGGYPGTFLDIAASLAHLPEIAASHNLDLRRVVVMGHSAGGHLALWLLGAHRVPGNSPIHIERSVRLRGAISLAGVTDLRRANELHLSRDAVVELLEGTPAQVPDRYAAASPIELLPLGVRHILIHGTSDDTVPFELSERYYQAAGNLDDPAELIALRGVGHFEVIDPMSTEFDIVREAVHSLL